MISIQSCFDYNDFFVDIVFFLRAWGEMSTSCILYATMPCYYLIDSICKSFKIAYDSYSMSRGEIRLCSLSRAPYIPFLDEEEARKLFLEVGEG